MPDAKPGTQQILAIAMMVSALTLLVVAALLYTGTIPVPDDVRFVAGLVVGAAALLDLMIGIWFFRKGQSS